MRLSAHALDRRDLCERRFTLEFGEHLGWPAAGSAYGRATTDPPGRGAALGQEFHRLVQRHRLGIPTRPEGEVAGLWEAFLTSPYADTPRGQGPAEALAPEPRDRCIWNEQVLQFALPGQDGEPVAFQVRFDELRRLGDGNWIILDWKTGRFHPRDPENLWQSRLYRFALAHAGEVLTGATVPPESIKLVYWLVSEGRGLPALPYDSRRFAADRRDLEAIARALVPLERAIGPADARSCSSCPFDSYCHAPVPPEAPTPPLRRPTFRP